jgi:hypothetical protein
MTTTTGAALRDGPIVGKDHVATIPRIPVETHELKTI